MPKLVPNASVIVIRDGKRKSPELGKAFDFSDAEVKQINRLLPGALRKPVNESATVADEDEGHTSDDSEAAKAPSKAAPDGSKKPTAAKGTKAAAKTKEVDKDVADEDADDAEEDEDI